MNGMSGIVAVAQQVTALLAGYLPLLVVLAGVVVAVAAVWVAVRAVRGGQVDRLAARVSIVLATALAAEGMWEVATEALGLPVYVALCLFATFEAAMTAAAIHARRTYHERGHTGAYSAAVWGIATTAGVVAALNAANLPEALVRLGMPLLAALLWWLDLHGRAPRHRATDATTWRISPRRLAIQLGLIEPADRDLVEVHREHHVEQLTVAAYKVHHHGRPTARRRHARRLRKLTLAADAEMIAEAVRRLERVHQIEDLTRPAANRTRTASTDSSSNTGPTVHEPAAAPVRELGHAPVRELTNRAARRPSTRTKPGNSSNPGSRITAEDYAAKAVRAYTPAVELNGAWIMQVTGCAKSTAYTKVLPLVRQKVHEQPVHEQHEPDHEPAVNGSRTQADNGTQSTEVDR